MKRYFILLILIALNFQFQIIFAQNQKAIDSLSHILINTKDSITKAEVLNALSTEYFGNDLEIAEEYCDKALQFSIQISYAQGISDSYRIKGIIHYKKSEFEKALDFYEKALKVATDNNYKKGISDCLNNIGNIHNEKGNYLEALQYYDKSLNIAEKTSYEIGISNSLCNKGVTYRLQGEYDKAKSFFKKSLSIAERLNYSLGISDCLHNMGIISRVKGDYLKALDYYQKSLNISEKLGDKKRVSKIFNNIGNVQIDQGNFSEAMEYYQQALIIHDELGDKKEISKCLNNIGFICMEQDSFQKALSYYEESLKIKEEIQYNAGIATSLNNIAEIYKKQKRYNKALEYYQKSLELRKSIGDKYGICYTYHGIAEVYQDTKNYNKALIYSLKSQQIANELSLLNRLKYNHLQLSEIYAGNKNYKKAYENYVFYKELNDSFLNVENIKKISVLEYQYEYEKEKQATELEQQKRKALLEEEAKRQTIVRNSLISGFFLMAILALVVFRSFLQKRRANVILADQNEEIATQRDQLDKQHTAISDSIVYAKRIQKAVLPPQFYIEAVLPEHFILFKPKDVVSGDFYWIRMINDYVVLAAADCTGHGVPGAFMSMLGISFLNEIVQKREVTQANHVLNELREQIKYALRQTGRKGEADDGLDIALCGFDPNTKILQYSGAFNSLYVVQNNELTEIKADKMPIGYYPNEKSSFTNHVIQLKSGDNFYVFSDGYIDQFGGKKGFKYRSSNFQKLLLKNHQKPLEIQKELLEKEHESWKIGYEQTDDIIVIGVRV